jgi:hypothetical protein
MIQDLASFFVYEKRGDGSSFLLLSPDAPESLRDAVKAAHEEELPNDWRYEVCCRAALALKEEPDSEPEDLCHSVAQSMATPYTGSLLVWYAEMPARLSYAEEAEDLSNASSVLEALTMGQYEAAHNAAALFYSALSLPC